MIRVLTFLVVVAASALGAAWLVERPGQVLLNWQGWRIETSVLVLAAALLLLILVIMIAWSLLRFLASGPTHLSDYFRGRRREKGFRALSRGMIAAGAGDGRLARQYAGEAHRLMRGEPLTLLLDAQAAQLSGDRSAARSAFETMLRSPETELLGLRGLYIEAQRAGDDAAARAFAQRAAERAPALGWASGALLDYQGRSGDWPAALETVERNAANKLIEKKEARRVRAVLLTAQALESEDRDAVHALALALEAHRLAPELVPASVVAGRLSASAGNTRQATRVLEKTWKLAPHPDIAEVYGHARPGDSARDRLKRVRALAQKLPTNAEGRLAVATAAIEARDWKAARESLAPLLGQPTQRVCMLMAEIAEGEEGDAGRVREWLSRALRAPRDPAWVADGYVSQTWEAVSPVTGRIDAFEWKVPLESIAAEEDVSRVSEPAPVDLELEATEPVLPHKADAPVPPRPAPLENPEPAAKPAAVAAASLAASDGPAKPPAPPAPASKSEPEIILPRPPDDPGTDPDEEEARPYR